VASFPKAGAMDGTMKVPASSSANSPLLMIGLLDRVLKHRHGRRRTATQAAR
jgi:hypothetical protein